LEEALRSGRERLEGAPVILEFVLVDPAVPVQADVAKRQALEREGSLLGN